MLADTGRSPERKDKLSSCGVISFLARISHKQINGYSILRTLVSLVRVLGERLPDRMAEALARWSAIESGTILSQLSREQRRMLVHSLTNFLLPVERDRGWNFAEVTAGGVPLEEINFRTMESRVVKGLYLVGEMLDCDGRIGGFIFQWAWATGHAAGRAVTATV